VSWEAPNFGTVKSYKVYRLYGPLTATSAAAVALVETTSNGTTFSVVDRTELPDGSLSNPKKDFFYYVVAVFDNATSPASNFEKVTPKNDAPAASADGYTPAYSTPKNTSLTKVAAVDGDSASTGLQAISPSTNLPVTTMPTAHGSVSFKVDATSKAFVFVYTPAKNYTGPDTFSYYVNDGTFSYVAADGTTKNTGAVMSANSQLFTVSITVTK
jgi:hypothetical protein